MKDRKIQDLHNHTIYSDGGNTVRELVENAIKNNIDIIGITDHLYIESMTSNEGRLDLNKYINELKNLIIEYKCRIEIKSALEISVIPYPEIFHVLPYDFINELDYVLFENLELLSLKTTLEELEVKLKNIKCKIGLAHTDLYELASIYEHRGGLNYVIDFMKRNNVFYEINASSSRLVFDTIIYERENSMVKALMELLKSKDIKLSAGSDTHSIKYFEYDRLLAANLMIDSNDMIII